MCDEQLLLTESKSVVVTKNDVFGTQNENICYGSLQSTRLLGVVDEVIEVDVFVHKITKISISFGKFYVLKFFAMLPCEKNVIHISIPN